MLILLSMFFVTSSKGIASRERGLSHGFLSEGKVEFLVDYARFIRSESLTVFEFYYTVNLNTLRKKNDLVSFRAKVEINGGSFEKPITSEWSQHTTKPLNYSLDKFWVILAPGAYDLSFTVFDNNSKNKGEVKFKINTLTLDTTISMSDIELLYDMFPGEDSVFGKFGYVQIPNPSGTYGMGKDTLFFYAEVYNLSSDTLSYFIRYFILDEKETPLRATKPIVRNKAELPLVRDGIDLSGLKPGRYILRIQVVDQSNGSSTFRDIDFYYLGSQELSESSLKQMEYYYFIDYYATPEELKEFKSLPEEGKLMFLKKFWKRFDPTPNTEYNEFFAEFVKRCQYADEHFSVPGKPGRLTDRGRIYIKYGPPDEINRVTFELTSRNREHWIYYGKGVKEFVFVDIKNSGDYELVYSTEKEEPSKPDWMKYVSPEDLQRQSF